MSKKFEIINDKWIRDLQTEPKNKHHNFTVKISMIHSVHLYVPDEAGFKGGWCIMLLYSGTSLNLFYKKEERAEYEIDLNLLENLIFNQ